MLPVVTLEFLLEMAGTAFVLGVFVGAAGTLILFRKRFN